MKIFIATDIHGSLSAMEQLACAIEREKPTRVIILGDLFNHGPRNGLPDGYDPKAVCALVRDIKLPLTVIKGNCDSEVDEMITDLRFKRKLTLTEVGSRICFEHGHKLSELSEYKSEKIDCVVYGHTHENAIEKKEGVTFVNVASPSMPKNGAQKSYAVIECEVINRLVVTIKDMDGKALMSTEI